MAAKRKNDRPNRFDAVGRLQCFNVENIPPDYASIAEWERRGYKVKKTELNNFSGSVSHWNGRNYLEFRLYKFEQCKPINGVKAGIRRAQYNNATGADRSSSA